MQFFSIAAVQNAQSAAPIKESPTKEEPADAKVASSDPAPNESVAANVPVSNPVPNGTEADNNAQGQAAVDANKKSEVAGQELGKKVSAIEGEVNKALEDQQSQQVAGA